MALLGSAGRNGKWFVGTHTYTVECECNTAFYAENWRQSWCVCAVREQECLCVKCQCYKIVANEWQRVQKVCSRGKIFFWLFASLVAVKRWEEVEEEEEFEKIARCCNRSSAFSSIIASHRLTPIPNLCLCCVCAMWPQSRKMSLCVCVCPVPFAASQSYNTFSLALC